MGTSFPSLTAIVGADRRGSFGCGQGDFRQHGEVIGYPQELGLAGVSLTYVMISDGYVPGEE